MTEQTEQTAFLKITYSTSLPDAESAASIPSYASINAPGIIVKHIGLYDPDSTDLGSGLLSDTLDAWEDAEKDEQLQSINVLRTAMTSIADLDPKKVGLPAYVNRVRQICQDALNNTSK